MAEGENFSPRLEYFSPYVKPNNTIMYDRRNGDRYILDEYTYDYTRKFEAELRIKKNRLKR